MSALEWLVVAAPVVLLPVAYLTWWFDRYRFAPLARFSATFALGLAAGLLLVAYWPAAASGWQVAGPMAPMSALTADILPNAIAETTRLVVAELAVLLILLVRGRVETPLDGAIYGVAAGVGSALPAGWLLAASAPSLEITAHAVVTLASLTAGVVVGAAVGWARLSLRWAARILGLLGCAAAGIAAIVAAHLAAAAAGRLWVGIPVLVAALALAVAAALLIEVRVASRQLAEEATLGVLPAWVVEVIPRLWRRARSAWWPRRDERKALVRLLLQLAVRKHQVGHLGGARATVYSLEVGRLRERARRLLDPARLNASAREEVE